MSEAEVRAALKAAGLTWESFERWITGQTIGLEPDGSARYYRHDVERFLHWGERTPVLD